MPDRSLLIFRLSALGDVIHTMPAVADLRASLGPRSRIGWVVEAPFREVVEIVAPADVVIPVATKRWRKRPWARVHLAEMFALRRALRDFGRDAAAIDFQGLLKSAFLARLSGASPRFGFTRELIREPAALRLLNAPLQITPAPEHVVDLNRALARAALEASGAQPKTGSVDWSGFPQSSGELDRVLDEETVVVLPGAGKPEKQWNFDHFRSLATSVSKSLARRVLVVWGPGERALAEAIAEGSPAEVAPPTRLRELASVLRRARLVIGGDTGPLHLAAALGTDVIGLYGPTNPRRNGPWGQVNRCIKSVSRSIDDIAVDAVLERASHVLGEPRGSRLHS